MSMDYLTQLAKLIKLILWFTIPYETIGDERKLSRRVIKYYGILLLGWTSATVHAFEQLSRSDLTFSEKAEHVIIVLMLSRSVLYIVSMFAQASEREKVMQRIIDEREAKRATPEALPMTLKYSKIEYIVSIVLCIYIAFVIVAIISSAIFVFDRNYLPYSFNIIFLHYNQVFSIKWGINFIFQMSFLSIVGAFYAFYVTLMVDIMDHSCWAFDNLMILVGNCQTSLETIDPSSSTVESQLKQIFDGSYEVLEWQNDARNLLRFTFFVDFTMQALMSGVCLASLALDVESPAFIYAVLVVTLPQLYMVCWMGERIYERIDKLAAAIYDLPWYLISAKQQRKLLLVLLMSQRMEGFDGLFSEVNMETFQAILNFTYKVFTLLRSTK